MKNNIDVYKYYCYLYDSIGINESKKFDFHIGNPKDTINGKCYKDPDSNSKKLYEDMATIYSCKANDMNLGLSIKNKDYKLIIESSTCNFEKIGNNFTTDYIGPSRSRTGAKSTKVNASEYDIGQVLRICRTIGGHIFWPSTRIEQKYTINQQRGGYTLCDRIDYTLAELKLYMEHKESKYYTKLYETFERYNEWFNVFRDNSKDPFKCFVEFFFLDDFVNENGDVLDLSTEGDTIKKKCIPFDKNSYSLYTKNLKSIIHNRTKTIVEYALTIQDKYEIIQSFISNQKVNNTEK